MTKPYVMIAENIARQITTGELAVGSRLPPQRKFAFDRGIAVSTASRVYEELRRRGLVSGEVGRGTFVAARFTPLDPAIEEPAGTDIDLDIVFRLSRDDHDLIAQSTARFFRSGLTMRAAGIPSVRAQPSEASKFSRMASVGRYSPDPESILLAGNGKQAIAACFAAIAPNGGRFAVEALTYPFVISVARMLGIDLVPLPVDEEGIIPEALEAEAKRGLKGVYLQPTHQSPLVLSMSDDRRRKIATILRNHELPAIEDAVYSFLRPAPPLAVFAPNQVIRIDSFSKRCMPGLSLGLIMAPPRVQNELARSIKAGGWMAPSLSVALASHWLEEGIVGTVANSKREQVNAMFQIACRELGSLDFRGACDALHGWLALPAGWRGESFAACCAKLGIAVAPGTAFAVAPGVAPNGVRIAFSAKDEETWSFALGELARLAKNTLD